LKRLLIPFLALSLIAAAPANRTAFEFDERIPAENQLLLEQALGAAIASQTNDGATVIVSLRIIEPEPERGLVLADAAVPTPPAERSR
jgi:hypothetical protein